MAKNWERDFRYQGIKASVVLAQSHPDLDPFEYPFSFCLPLAQKPISAWVTPGRIMILSLVLGFAGLGGGALLASSSPPGNAGFDLRLALAGCCSLSGFLFLLLPLLLHKHVIRWCVGQRGKELMQRAAGQKVIHSELGNAVNPTLSVDGDDHVLILLDRQNRRLLIEGISATYQIRAEDIVSIAPFTYMSYLGANIVYRIGDDTVLQVGIAKTNQLKEFTRQAPWLFFLDRWIKNRTLQDIQETLSLPTND